MAKTGYHEGFGRVFNRASESTRLDDSKRTEASVSPTHEVEAESKPEQEKAEKVENDVDDATSLPEVLRSSVR